MPDPETLAEQLGAYHMPVTEALAMWKSRAERAESQAQRLQEALEAIAALHQPDDEEAELWFDEDDHADHDRRFPDCHATETQQDRHCDGHFYKVQVCRECGYEHDDGYPIYRGYPCPTASAVLASLEENTEPQHAPMTDIDGPQGDDVAEFCEECRAPWPCPSALSTYREQEKK